MTALSSPRLSNLGRCPSNDQPSKQQNRTWTTFSTVLGQPSQPYEIPLRRALRPVALLVGLSAGNPPKLGLLAHWNGTQNRTRTPPDICAIKVFESQRGTYEISRSN